LNPRIAGVTLVAFVMACATTTPPAPKAAERMQGVASWYGEEFAGRTTANGEIFDPLQLTAAHRTLPFGTVVDVTNPKTRQSVRVRVNDRGPYIGGRVIDLSYAAAQQIGLIEPGIGEVQIAVVRVGSGEREPPAPLEITIAEAPKTAPVAGDAPAVAFPVPATPESAVEQVPVVVDRVDVVENRGGVDTRRQVSSDGRTIENVPVDGGAPVPSSPGHSTAEAYDRLRRTAATPAPAPAPVRKRGHFVVQVGAFAVEENAKLLQDRLTKIGQTAWIDRDDLFRVRIGPFETRDQAVAARSTLEVNGISAIVMAE
jgi:rare lipoprotein A